MLPGRGALRSVSSAARRVPPTGQLGSTTRGFATSRIGGGRHAYLYASTTGVSALTRLRSGAVAGSVSVAQVPSSHRALSLWGSSKKPEPPAAQNSPPPTPPQPEAVSQATTHSPPAADVASAADTTNTTQSGGWSLWGWGSSKTPAQPAELPAQATPPDPPATAAAVSDPAATSAVHPNTVSADLSQIISSDLDAYGSVSAIPEKIGYLHTLGIEFGYGTTSMLQWLFEHIHVYSGLPWWGSILATSVILRALLWKPVLMGQEATTRLNVLKLKEPSYERALEAQKQAAISKDYVGLQAARVATSSLEQKYGVNKLMPFINFLQLPIGFGMFRILRAMSDLPVPSLENGGCLWFTDLTVPDPWYILPLVGPLSMFVTMRLTNRFATAQQKKAGKAMAAVFVPVGLVFTSFLPAGLQFYFLTAGATGLFQTALIFNPGFRKLVGLTPLPDPKDHPAPPSAGEGKGIIESVKASVRDAQEMAGSKMDASSEKKKGDRKMEEEARLQAEYYESLRERMAELEKKMKRRP